MLSLLDSLLLSLSAVLWEELLLVLSEVEALEEVLSQQVRRVRSLYVLVLLKPLSLLLSKQGSYSGAYIS